jgi:drug/metabolite transporter (DMT)-like permease
LHWVFIAIFFSFGFVQLFKGSQRRGEYAPVVVSANYLALSLALAIFLYLTNQWVFTPDIFKIGISIGITFIASMLVMTYGLTVAGVAPVMTAFRLSMLLPVALSVIIWAEPITLIQLTGITLAIVALALMTHNKSSTHPLRGTKAFVMIFTIFIIQGVGMTCMRWVHYAGLDPYRLNVLMVIGATAGTLGWIFVLIRRQTFRPKDVYVGLGIGLYNTLALSVVLTALSVVPGTVYFPIVGCSVVLLDNLSAHFFWKEYLTRPAIAGVCLAVVAITLVM